MEYILHVLAVCFIYGSLVISLGFILNQSGVLSLCHAGFFGTGAYCSAVISMGFGGFLAGASAGMLVSIGLAVLLAFISLRLRDDYFVLATFGLNVVLFDIFNNAGLLTGGATGISGIPPVSVFGVALQGQSEWLVLVASTAIASAVVVARLGSGPFGRVLRLVSGSEVLAQSLGKNPLGFKLIALATSAALASLAGSLYAHYVGFVDPTSFGVEQSLLLVSMAILGGTKGVWGSWLGAVGLITFPEALRFWGLPNGFAANIRQVAVGILLVLMIVHRSRQANLKSSL